MQKTTLAALLLLSAACQHKDPQQTAATANTPNETVAAAPPDSTTQYLANPKVGDVLVVRFQPEGAPQQQFYFYQVFRLAGDTVLTRPALKPAATADADVRTLGVFSPDAVRAYTRAELQEYRREDPMDPQHTRLIGVRRGE
ncbi:hypothetical protein [Hymenobacter koreensis]|uniref:Uncharacterized protein n=1 Tax=Hymenobacter koreensis TaxID=1084523 RepID=A0ABP8IUD1_9BACT